MDESTKQTDDWARQFFTGVFVDFWLACTPPEQTKIEADFLEAQLRVKPGAKLLDIACGGGRHAVELAGRGYDLTAVDLSREFLAHARSAGKIRDVAVDWQERAMHDLPWENQFDGAYCLGNSLGSRDEAALAAGFAAAAKALKPGGRFLVDCGFVAESILPNLKERPWWQIGEFLFVVKNTYVPQTSRLDHEFTIVRGGQTDYRRGFSQVLSFREFRNLFKSTGFTSFEAFGSLAAEPYRLGAQLLYLVATKPPIAR